MEGLYALNIDSSLPPSVNLIGPKAIGLFHLMALQHLGFRVPEGFVLTTNAYNEVYRIEAENIDRVLKGRTRGLAKTADLIQRLLMQPKLIPFRFLLDVIPAYEALSTRFGTENINVAVRSSAINEDTKSKSYAGAYESFLNIVGSKSLENKIFRCFASAWTHHLYLERFKSNNIPKNASIALIIQRMICSDVAGVIFTADPLSGDNSKMSINSGWGLGDAIVSGVVNSDIYIYDKKRNDFSDVRIGNKDVMSRCNQTEGVHIHKTPLELINKPSLPPKHAFKLVNVCQEIEKQFQYPVDVEWAIYDDELYLLQVRPITTL